MTYLSFSVPQFPDYTLELKSPLCFITSDLSDRDLPTPKAIKPLAHNNVSTAVIISQSHSRNLQLKNKIHMQSSQGTRSQMYICSSPFPVHLLAAAGSIAASVFHRAAQTCWILSSPDVQNCSEASALNPGIAIHEPAQFIAPTLPQVTRQRLLR